MIKKSSLAIALASMLVMSGCNDTKPISYRYGGYAYDNGLGTSGTAPVVSSGRGSVNDDVHTGVIVGSDYLVGKYLVVVGVFSDVTKAMAFENVMKSRGFTGATRVINPMGQYRVVAGVFDNVAAARKLRDQLRFQFPNDDPNTTPKAWILVPVSVK